MVYSPLYTGRQRTLTLCPKCTDVVDGWLFEKKGDIWLQAQCPEHGSFEALYFRDANLYRQAEKLIDRGAICRKLNCARKQGCSDHLKHTYNIMINLTQRCNMDCPVCFAEVENDRILDEPTPEQIFKRLPKARPINNPNVVFIGGEPTLRKDLPELISGVRTRGFVPRLSTNGHKLLDIEYARTLKDAGLYWIVLQFDGLNDEVYKALRGQSLLEEKKQIIANCHEVGIAVQLAVMVDAERNADQIGPILEYGFKTPAIKWVNFYPRTVVNRHNFSEAGLHVSQMLQLFEEQTDGHLTRRDFLEMMRTFSLFNKITGAEVLRQKISTWPMVLIRSDHGFTPLSKLLTPRGLVRHRKATIKIIHSLPKIFQFQQMEIPPDLLFITMEKFHSSYAIDLCEASCCHMAYMVKDGFVPFDIYNCLYRDRSNW